MKKTFREYGLITRITDSYYEVHYVEYNENLEIVQTGTEDFSYERIKSNRILARKLKMQNLLQN
jgi:hypothetical protein